MVRLNYFLFFQLLIAHFISIKYYRPESQLDKWKRQNVKEFYIFNKIVEKFLNK